MLLARLHGRLRAVLAELVVCAVRSLPPRSAAPLGETLGTLWWALDRRRRRRAHENLRLAFGPAADPTARRRLVRAVFRHMGRVPVELVWLPRLLASPAQVERRCRFLGPWERVAAGSRPGVLVSGHLGAWEAILWAAPPRLGPLRTVVRPLPQPEFDAVLTRLRGGPQRVLPKHGATRGLLRALRRDGWVALACDQQAGARGPFVPFFGWAASTAAAPARLALRAGAPLVLVSALRRPGLEPRWDLHLDAVADGAREAGAGTSHVALLTRVQEALERRVRQAPGQYNFLYRRWRHRPAGEAPRADGPRYDERPRRA